jgi:hypothetical protein
MVGGGGGIRYALVDELHNDFVGDVLQQIDQMRHTNDNYQALILQRLTLPASRNNLARLPSGECASATASRTSEPEDKIGIGRWRARRWACVRTPEPGGPIMITLTDIFAFVK